MQNPLEKFLLNLAEKIQTEKEYKEIVSNSQSVDVNKDVFAGFVEGIAKTIKENLKTPAVSGTSLEQPYQPEKDPLETFLGTLKDKLKEAPVKKPETKVVPVSAAPVVNEQPPQQEKDAFAGFVTNLADIIKKEKSKPVKKNVKIITDEDNEEEKKQTEETPSEEPVDDYVKILSTEKKKDKDKEEDDEEDDALKSFVSSYVNKELANFQKEMAEKMEELKDAVEREMMDDGAGDGGGGGTNSFDYYPGGGPMNGNLSFPVSGTGIIFANGQLLSSFPTGGGGGDPAVNSVVYSNSANWNSTYSTVNSYSATWSTGLQDLAFDENTALLSITNGNTVSLSALSGGGGGGGDPAVNNVVYSNSASWISNYTTSNYFSAFWNAAVDELFTFYVTQTSAASAFWTEDGNYYFIQNSKLDNAPLWNNMYTTLYLNSAGWESTETTVRTGSADWNSTYSSLSPNSAKYDSVYTTYNQNSASYATEILAIAYAVAL